MNIDRTMRFRVFMPVVAFLVPALARAEADSPLEFLKTPGGVEFGILGAKPAKPAATLFVFASDIRQTLADPNFNKAGSLLAKQDVLCVSVDLPCHGKDNKEKALDGLVGWRQRLEKDEEVAAPFAKRCREVLDHLVAEKFTDPDRVAVASTSRGGFLAFHFAATEPRVRAVVAFAPVTELSALSEFRDMKPSAAFEAASLEKTVDKLTGRAVWIWIGDDDQRVGTQHAVAFAKKLSKKSQVEIHVKPAKGHTVNPAAHDEAAAWLAKQFTASRQPSET